MALPLDGVIALTLGTARFLAASGLTRHRSAQLADRVAAAQSARPRYRRFDEALPGIRLDAWEERAAVDELVDRYVRRYGPVTERDIAWWTGLGRAAVRDAVAELHTSSAPPWRGWAAAS